MTESLSDNIPDGCDLVTIRVLDRDLSTVANYAETSLAFRSSIPYSSSFRARNCRGRKSSRANQNGPKSIEVSVTGPVSLRKNCRTIALS